MSLAYRLGTIAVANGGNTVTGTLTAWFNQVKQGDIALLPDGKFYEVAADAPSNTSFDIVEDYEGTTVASGGVYAIFRFSSAWRPTAELSIRIANFLASTTAIYSGSGAPDNSLGGDNSAYFRSDAPELYFKAGGVWGSPISLTGPTGPTGPTYAGTSTTSRTLNTGSMTITTQAALAWLPGARIRIASAASPSTHFMEGEVTAYNSGTGSLTFTSDYFEGTGARADWNLSLAGERGTTGAQGAGYATTSTASLLIGTGTKAFTGVATTLGYTIGQRARAASAADTTNWMEGRVTGYSGSTLTLSVDVVGGSGTFADWSINVAGSQGIQGIQGAQGIQGIQGVTGASYAATSTTPLAIGTGAKASTTQTGLAYVVGSRVRMSSAANTSNYMEGICTAYNSGTGAITIDVAIVGGSGTFADWNFSLSGERGSTGATGATGATGPGGPNYNATSSTSLVVSTGSKAFTVASGLPYIVGQRLRAASTADPTVWMSGLVASYSSTTLTLTVDLTGAAGTAADWLISITGEKGDAGPAGGVTGATTDNAIARFDGVLGSLQNSAVTLSDTGFLSGASGFLANGNGLSGPQCHLYTDDAANQANLTVTSYAINGGGTFHANHARGTLASPSATLSGDITGGIGSRAYHSGGAFQTSSPASIHWQATENQSSTAYGMWLRFLTTPQGSTTRQERGGVTDNGVLWAHDTATFNAANTGQTKPFVDNLILASGGASGVSVASVAYGLGLTSGFRAGSAGGTPASPTATQSGTTIAYVGGHGYGATGWSNGTKGIMSFVAAENWTDSAQGTYCSIGTTPTGSTTRAERIRVLADGNVGIGTTAPTRKLVVSDGGNLGIEFFPNDGGVNRIFSYDRGTIAYKPFLFQAEYQYFQTSGATNTPLYLYANGSVHAGNGALATNATTGFLYVPTCAGTPTGAPTSITGYAPIIVNTTNNKLYFYSGGAWRDAGP